MIETAMVFSTEGKPLFWHEPPGRTSARIPDSTELWNIIWENRECLGGVAHTHVGTGMQWPSKTDTSTFAAIEAALGKRLVWPIIGETRMDFFSFNPKLERYDINHSAYWEYGKKPGWRLNIELLMQKSKGDHHA